MGSCRLALLECERSTAGRQCGRLERHVESRLAFSLGFAQDPEKLGPLDLFVAEKSPAAI